MMDEEGIEAYGKLFVHCWSSYAVQQRDGRYWRVGGPLTLGLLAAHVRGLVTLGTYLLDERDTCAFAVFDADSGDGLERLTMLAEELRCEGVRTLLEVSRRGGHLWVHLAAPTPAVVVRSWLVPYAHGYGLELYPKQDVCASGPGSLMRLPLGVHRRSGGWYPFVVVAAGGSLVPVGRTVEECSRWACASVERVRVPVVVAGTGTLLGGPVGVGAGVPGSLSLGGRSGGRGSIRAWCRSRDVLGVMSRYVALDRRGMGSCPFKEHHARGDVHLSFQVFAACDQCWYCYTWQRGGDVFDFLCLYHGLSLREGWRCVQSGRWD